VAVSVAQTIHVHPSTISRVEARLCTIVMSIALYREMLPIHLSGTAQSHLGKLRQHCTFVQCVAHQATKGCICMHCQPVFALLGRIWNGETVQAFKILQTCHSEKLLQYQKMYAKHLTVPHESKYFRMQDAIVLSILATPTLLSSASHRGFELPILDGNLPLVIHIYMQLFLLQGKNVVFFVSQ
jgi:hypothetical protein